MEDLLSAKEQRHPGKDRKRDKRPSSAMVVYLGNEVASSDIESDAAGDRQGIGDSEPQHVTGKEQNKYTRKSLLPRGRW
jgi:hypothetical protein